MTSVVKIKIMPSSPEVDLEEVKKRVTEITESSGGRNANFEEEPIAFGLKALITTFLADEDVEIEPIERKLEEVENINSVELIDIRKSL